MKVELQNKLVGETLTKVAKNQDPIADSRTSTGYVAEDFATDV